MAAARRARARGGLGGLLVALALLAGPARAQEADSLAAAPDSLVAPADTTALVAETLVADTLAAPADTAAVEAPLPVGFGAPEPGRPVGGVPARRAAITAAEGLAEAPGAFLYDLGTPGAAHGVSLLGLPPRRTALALDGVPASGLFSGRPAWELLPTELLAPLRLAPGRYGEAAGVEAALRGFGAGVPVTELRYHTGPDALQFVSATHAQTRRPGFVGRSGRLHALFHVSGRRADGPIANAEVGGWQALARVGVVRPRFSVEVTERHGRGRAGAGGGVASAANAFADGAPVLRPNAGRETIRNDLSATLRLRLLGAAPLTATAFWTAETFRYTDLGADTLEAVGRRYGARLAQPFALGRHRLRARADAWVDRLAGGTAFVGEGAEATVHLAVEDSLALGGFEAGLMAGWHRAPGASFPTAAAGVERAAGAVRLRLGARYAGASYAWMERSGFGGVLRVANSAGTERALVAEAALAAALGPFDLAAEAAWVRREDPRVLLAEGDSAAAFETVGGRFSRFVGSLALGWRDRAARGFYLRLRADAQRLLNPDDSPVHRREAAALPDVWGRARLGYRARALFDGALDLDLAVQGRAWTAFRGRALHAPTGLFALAEPGAAEVPARGTVDVVAEARLGRRALVFLTYENALAGRAYDGAYVVPVYPLPGPGLRIGLFWVLAN